MGQEKKGETMGDYRIFIINKSVEGRAGSTEQEYLQLAETLGKYQNYADHLYQLLGFRRVKFWQIKMVKSAEEALKQIKPSDTTVFIFITGNELKTAREIKRKYPKIKVIVLSACLDKEVILIDKTWTNVDGILLYCLGFLLS